MQNMVLATPVLSDAATLSASATAGSLPVSNLQEMDIQKVWRATDASAAFLVIDLGAAKEINLIALLGHSGSSRSYARVRGAANEADLTADPDYDSGNLPMRSHQSGYDGTWASGVADEEYGALDKNMFLKWLGTDTETLRWLRIDLVDPNASYIDVGRLYVAKAWQPETNMDYSLAEGFIDDSPTARTVGGVLAPVERKKRRWSEFTLSFATQDEIYDNAFEIERLRGSTKDVLYIHDPTATNHLQRRSIYGSMKGMQPIINHAFSLFSKSFRIEEIPT